MIIAGANKRLFTGLTVNVEGIAQPLAINYHYGNQKELVKWVFGQGNKKKYPLIWYVLAPFTEHEGWYETTSEFIIIQDTQPQWFNTDRNLKTYERFIDPTYQVFKKKLLQSPYVQVLGDSNDKFRLKDEPLHGVDVNEQLNSSNDFSNKSKKGEQSISPDWVDTRIVRLNYRIKANCIK